MKRSPMMLRLWQREKGFSDQEAADYFEVSRMTWQRWKKGIVPAPPHVVALFCEGVAQPNDFYDLPAQKPARSKVRDDAVSARPADAA